MTTHKEQFKTMDEYIRTFPWKVQAILQKVRRAIRKAAPGAVEAISYQIPTFRLNGKYLIYFAAWKSHIALYPIPSGNEAFRKQISPYKKGKGTLRFPIEQPIPYDLVKRIVMLRIRDLQKKK